MAVQGRRVVVLGGGSGGISAAASLGHALNGQHTVALIDRQSRHVYQPDYLWLMTGRREPHQLTRPLQHLRRFGVEVLQREVTRIDPQKQIIHTETVQVPFDYLVISLGLQTHPADIPGDSGEAHHVWELPAAERFRDALRTFRRGKLVVGVFRPPYRCPPAPYEVMWLLDAHFKELGIRDAVEIAFFSSEAGPLGGGTDAARWIRQQSEARGISMHYGFELTGVDGATKMVRASDGRELPYDLLMVVPPHRPAQVLLDSGLAEQSGIHVCLDDLSTAWENVYAIGDCTDVPASKAGVVAHQEADLVAHNLAVELLGRGQRARFKLQTT